MLISIETHITYDFPGGGPDHPLYPHIGSTSSEGAGSERDVGYF